MAVDGSTIPNSRWVTARTTWHSLNQTQRYDMFFSLKPQDIYDAASVQSLSIHMSTAKASPIKIWISSIYNHVSQLQTKPPVVNFKRQLVDWSCWHFKSQGCKANSDLHTPGWAKRQQPKQQLWGKASLKSWSVTVVNNTYYKWLTLVVIGRPLNHQPYSTIVI